MERAAFLAPLLKLCLMANANRSSHEGQLLSSRPVLVYYAARTMLFAISA